MSENSDSNKIADQIESSDVDSILRKFVPNLDMFQQNQIVTKKGPKKIAKKTKSAKSPLKPRVHKSAEIKNQK